MSLIEQITAKRQEISAAESHVSALKNELTALFALQMKCEHDFQPPAAHYAHEGGKCRHCGMNEIHWAMAKPRN